MSAHAEAVEGHVRRLAIHCRRPVDSMLAGEYRSVFKGRGVEFDEVREYQPGDDFRSIDWNVTARTGKPFVKRYIEERELTVYLVCDVSASFMFGGGGRTKRDAAAELAALIGLSAARNNDRVGLVLFSEEVELFIPPGKGEGHIRYLLEEMLAHRPKHTGTDITEALDFIDRIAHQRSVLILLSDFLSRDFDAPLQVLRRHHDVVAASVRDPHESEIPDVGLVWLHDSETGERRVVDTSMASVRRGITENATLDDEALHRRFDQMDIDLLSVSTDGDAVGDLVTFFAERKQRGGHGATI